MNFLNYKWRDWISCCEIAIGMLMGIGMGRLFEVWLIIPAVLSTIALTFFMAVWTMKKESDQ